METQTNTRKPRLLWFDALRGLAMVWIVFYHFIADTGRLWQFVSISSPNPLTTIDFIVRTIGQHGAQGVHMFIILSGAGLAFAWAQKKTSVGDFYRRHFPPTVDTVLHLDDRFGRCVDRASNHPCLPRRQQCRR